MQQTANDLPLGYGQEGTTRPAAAWWQFSVLVVLSLTIYSRILTQLVADWLHDPNYSHGLFDPLFSAYVIWTQRRRLADVPIKPSWFGIVVIAAAMLALIAGDLGAEFFLSRASLLVLLAGLVIGFLGWRFFGAVLFPWGVLFLMIPIPVILFNQVAFPLQLLASRLASMLLGLLGVPVLREGNVIQLPSLTLEVVEACSGIRSLVSLLTLSVIYGYVLERRMILRILVIIAAVPIAVAANAARIVGTGLMGQYWNPARAIGFFHTFAGWVVFMLSLGMLVLLHGVMRMLVKYTRARHL